ncbi:MAG: hypothetical protein KAS32_10695 [Candidatus Peribacteraceae bacterium]|nr:hypothetical protein [Candidatus Peribacteraceae bacterium]
MTNLTTKEFNIKAENKKMLLSVDVVIKGSFAYGKLRNAFYDMLKEQGFACGEIEITEKS